MHLWAQIEIHATFLAFVALAVYAQALTGFALALILLGLVGATNLVPLTDAVNASTLTGFCTAWMFLHRRGSLHVERVLVPTLIASVAGVVAGALLVGWLAATAYQLLRLVLGISIVACALSLWRAAQPLPANNSITAARTWLGIVAALARKPGGETNGSNRMNGTGTTAQRRNAMRNCCFEAISLTSTPCCCYCPPRPGLLTGAETPCLVKKLDSSVRPRPRQAEIPHCLRGR